MKTMLVLVVTVTLIAGVGAIFAVNGFDRLEHVLAGKAGVGTANGDGQVPDANPADAPPPRPTLEIQPYNPKANDANLYARARWLIQMTQALTETREKLIRPPSEQLNRPKQTDAGPR